jgi:hypothetical protein
MSERYPVFFEKMILRCIANMKALLPLEGNVYHTGFNYFQSLRKAGSQPDKCSNISNANGICLSNAVNAVFCNRVSILVFMKRKPGVISPHNPGASQEKEREIDSS